MEILYINQKIMNFIQWVIWKHRNVLSGYVSHLDMDFQKSILGIHKTEDELDGWWSRYHSQWCRQKNKRMGWQRWLEWRCKDKSKAASEESVALSLCNHHGGWNPIRISWKLEELQGPQCSSVWWGSGWHVVCSSPLWLWPNQLHP